MTLACVESLCRAHNISYHKEENGISITIYGQYKMLRYPVLVSQTGEPGSMQALIWFPEPETQNLEEVEMLCAALNNVFNPYVQVGFNGERGRFWAGSLFADNAVKQKLSALVQACDILYPLITRVGCLGRWSGDLIQLACTDPQDCAGRA